MGINQVLTGWIQKDPEMRFTPNGKPVTSFSISCPAGKEKDDNGVDKNAYTYVRVSVWNDLAEYVNTNYKEGEMVIVTGILKAGKPWKPDNGDYRSNIEFTAFEIEKAKK